MAKGKGQIPFEPTDEQRTLVMALAAAGVPQEQICLEVKWPEASLHQDAGKPITKPTLRKCFRRELDNGMQRANGKVIATAFEMATKDKVPAMVIFWLKTRCGWKEPAQDVNLSLSYLQLVEAAAKKAEEARRAQLTVIEGGKAAAA